MFDLNSEEKNLLDKWCFTIIKRLERPFYLATEGYVSSENEFGDTKRDPYIAIKFDKSNQEHMRLVINSSLRQGLNVIFKVANGYQLSENEEKYLVEGYSYAHEFCDFAMENLFPLTTYLHATKGSMRDDRLTNDYMTDYNFCGPDIEILLLKFLTRIDMKYDTWIDHDSGLYRYLGFESDGYTFKQLQVILGFDTERTARGLALESTPIEKRIPVIKIGADKTESGIKRTLIKRNVFIEYVKKYNSTRLIAKEGKNMAVDIKLTGGNIRNNHVYLTKALDMFSDKYIGGSKKELQAMSLLKLDVGNNQIFETDIAGDKKIFRSREALKAFFGNFDVVEGDLITLSTSDGCLYKLRPKQ